MHLWHRYEPVGVKPMVCQSYRSPLWANWDGSPVKWGEPTPVTMVLYRCHCGKVKTQHIDGDWTLEEVKAA